MLNIWHCIGKIPSKIELHSEYNSTKHTVTHLNALTYHIMNIYIYIYICIYVQFPLKWSLGRELRARVECLQP